jgi:hypothetical protein
MRESVHSQSPQKFGKIDEDTDQVKIIMSSPLNDKTETLYHHEFKDLAEDIEPIHCIDD